MKKITQLAVGAVACLIGAPLASAGFVVTFDKTLVTSGPNAGDWVVKFYGQNDGLNGTGTKLLGVAATLSTDAGSHLIFRKANLDEDSVLDADVIENPSLTVTFADTTTRTTPAFSTNAQSANIGTAIRPVGTGAVAKDFSAQKFDPITPTSVPVVVTDADGNVVSATPTKDPSLTYTNNVQSFRVEGAYLGGASSPLATAPGPGGTSVNFAIALVPGNTQFVKLSLAQLAGDIGSIATIPDITVPIPEPTTFGLLGVVGAGLLARRRRNA